MTVHLFSPEGMTQPTPYAHVAVGTGTRHVHVAGQIARDADGHAVAPGDLAGQVAQALRNTALGLAGAGATFSDVVRLRFFVTNWSPEKGWVRLATNSPSPSPCRPPRSSGSTIFSNPMCSSKLRRTPFLIDRVRRE
jgi:enamine deaminase RidA (YjgF/YER057c/UK114 family)